VERRSNLVNSNSYIEVDCFAPARLALRTRTRLPAPEAQLMAGRSLAMTPMSTFYETIYINLIKKLFPQTIYGQFARLTAIGKPIHP